MIAGKALYFILGVVMLFMFILVAGTSQLGAARALLSVAFIGTALYAWFEFARRETPDRSVNTRQREYRELLESVQDLRGRRFADEEVTSRRR